MPREQSQICSACEQSFGSKWALTEHAKSCPVKRNAELVRIQEALAWKHERIERAVGICYRYAARALVAHHIAHSNEARRFRDWFTEEFEQSVAELELLGGGLREASQFLFPRLERMKREVNALREQVKDLQIIGSVMNGLIE